MPASKTSSARRGFWRLMPERGTVSLFEIALFAICVALIGVRLPSYLQDVVIQSFMWAGLALAWNIAGGYAGLGTAGATGTAVPGGIAAAGAGASAPAWMNSALWRTGIGMGTDALGTYLDNRGRQQAADTLAGAAERAGANTQKATEQSLEYARQMQAATQPHLQNPGYFQQGQTMPASFAQLAQPQGGLNSTAGLPAGAQNLTGFLDPNDPRLRAGGLTGASGMNVPTPQGRMTLEGETTPGGAAASPETGLPPVRQWIREQFLSPMNKNPQREPTERDYQYWEALAQRLDMDPAYLQQRMFDPEGQGSNAGHFVGGPQSFAQMAGPQFSPAPMNPYQAPPPSFGRPAPNFAQMAPPPVPFVPYPQGRR